MGEKKELERVGFNAHRWWEMGYWGGGMAPRLAHPHAGLRLHLLGACVGGWHVLTNKPGLMSSCPGGQEGGAHPLHHTQPQCHHQCWTVPTAYPAVGGEVAPGTAVPRVATGSRAAQGAWDDDNELSTALREDLGRYHKGWPGVAFN